MLPFLVLLIASSAVALPSYGDSSLIDRALEGFDRTDVAINGLNYAAVMKDLSRQGGNQPLANGQAVAYLGEISTGRPGDSCAAANYINSYTRYVKTGNSAGVREALGNYIRVVADNVDNIVGVFHNKDSFKYKTGRQGGCSGEGRNYQFEEAWDIILGSVAPNQQRLINEEYCVAKRLYCTYSASSNNIAAQATASALPPTVQVFEHASGPLTNFLAALGSKNNIIQSGSALKQAMLSSISKVLF